MFSIYFIWVGTFNLDVSICMYPGLFVFCCHDLKMDFAQILSLQKKIICIFPSSRNLLMACVCEPALVSVQICNPQWFTTFIKCERVTHGKETPHWNSLSFQLNPWEYGLGPMSKRHSLQRSLISVEYGFWPMGICFSPRSIHLLIRFQLGGLWLGVSI